MKRILSTPISKEQEKHLTSNSWWAYDSVSETPEQKTLRSLLLDFNKSEGVVIDGEGKENISTKITAEDVARATDYMEDENEKALSKTSNWNPRKMVITKGFTERTSEIYVHFEVGVRWQEKMYRFEREYCTFKKGHFDLEYLLWRIRCSQLSSSIKFYDCDNGKRYIAKCKNWCLKNGYLWVDHKPNEIMFSKTLMSPTLLSLFPLIFKKSCENMDGIVDAAEMNWMIIQFTVQQKNVTNYPARPKRKYPNNETIKNIKNFYLYGYSWMTPFVAWEFELNFELWSLEFVKKGLILL